MLLTVIFTLAVIFDLFLAIGARMGATLPKLEKDPVGDHKFGRLVHRAGILSAVLSSGILIGLHLQ